MVQWGDPIRVDGQRPDWLRDDETIVDLRTGYGWTCTERGAQTTPDCWAWSAITHIRFPVDHHYYLAIREGFTYWPGGDAAPADWDGGETLRQCGVVKAEVIALSVWSDRSVPGAVIGYRKRATDDPISNHMVAAPASYRGALDEESMFVPPAAPETTLPGITAEFIALVVNERDALRKRVTDLLEANNRLVEERRASENWQASFERSQDDLATVTAERDAYRQEARDYHEREVQRFRRLLDGQVAAEHLTITLSGPQGCGKTRFAEALRSVLRQFGATVEGDGCDVHPGTLMKEIVGGKPVTVIDMSASREPKDPTND